MRSTVVLTCAALCAFAANSLLCRAALGPNEIDAASFTTVRIVSGAIALALIARWRRVPWGGGGWFAAFALFAYAIAFSYAYLRIQAGVGALILFGSVQATMIGVGGLRGDGLRARQAAGLTLALGGLAWLVLPGAQAPDAVGAVCMSIAGAAWGAYSLLGRSSAGGARDPLATTARNFALAVPLALVVSAFAMSPYSSDGVHASSRGMLLAAASGAIASGVGYTIWYAALRSLPSSSAAIAQLAVPILAAIGGVSLLGETPNARLWTSGVIVLGGVAVALAPSRRTQTSPPRTA